MQNVHIKCRHILAQKIIVDDHLKNSEIYQHVPDNIIMQYSRKQVPTNRNQIWNFQILFPVNDSSQVSFKFSSWIGIRFFSKYYSVLPLLIITRIFKNVHPFEFFVESFDEKLFFVKNQLFVCKFHLEKPKRIKLFEYSPHGIFAALSISSIVSEFHSGFILLSTIPFSMTSVWTRSCSRIFQKNDLRSANFTFT